MNRTTVLAVLPIFTACLASGQSTDEAAKFEAADVHVSAKSQNPFLRTSAGRGGRYEVKNATMVDLIHLAYGFDNDKILGGPSWLEMDRFDVTGKVPVDSNADTQKLMLQALLADRFKLAVHKDTRPLPTFALVAGKKPQLKEGDATGDSGCHPKSQSGGEGGIRLMMTGRDSGAAQTISLGPDMSIQFECRNMTMEAFASGLRSMIGAQLGPNPVIDDTGLKGKWNFDIHWSMQLFGPTMKDQPERITVFDAVEKQLGLKLEERQVPTPVMVVDGVSKQPTGNPPGTAEALPPIIAPTEFEVASVKPADPTGRGFRSQMQPGGRVNFQGMPLRLLLMQAFSVNNMEQLAGIPAWADTERFDIIAKAPSAGPTAPPVDRDATQPMLRALLVDRFKMTYHTEDRQVSAYTLVAGKPKMKKADPASRTFCKNLPSPPGAPPGSRVLNCQNITMAQFAEQLQNMSPELNWPVADSTGIEGGWDFTLTYSMNFMAVPAMAMARGADGGGGGSVGFQGTVGAPGGGGAGASDPNGGMTIFEAIEKQTGLKLEKQKRTGQITVIDHLEQKPTEN